MKNILIISGIQVFPPLSGGHMRTTTICKSLEKSGHSVQIYSFTGRRSDYIHKKSSSNTKISHNINEYTNRSKSFGLVQYIFYKIGLPPIWLTILTNFFLPKTLLMMIKKSDIVVVDFPYLFPIFKFTKRKKILNTHNVESEIFQSRLLKKIIYAIERRAVQKSDITLFCNDIDKNKLSHLTQKETYLVPNGINQDDYVKSDQLRNSIRKKLNIIDKKIILFIGSNYQPNIEGYKLLTEWIAQNEQLLENYGIQILVVGSVADKDPQLKNLTVLGFVDDILKYFSAADYAINTVISGSGTNVKMVQYIASRIPILTTEFGARGLDLDDKQDCFYFTFNNLSKVISTISNTTADELERMTKQAYAKNKLHIDIDAALKKVNLEI